MIESMPGAPMRHIRERAFWGVWLLGLSSIVLGGVLSIAASHARLAPRSIPKFEMDEVGEQDLRGKTLREMINLEVKATLGDEIIVLRPMRTVVFALGIGVLGVGAFALWIGYAAQMPCRPGTGLWSLLTRRRRRDGSLSLAHVLLAIGVFLCMSAAGVLAVPLLKLEDHSLEWLICLTFAGQLAAVGVVALLRLKGPVPETVLPVVAAPDVVDCADMAPQAVGDEQAVTAAVPCSGAESPDAGCPVPAAPAIADCVADPVLVATMGRDGLGLAGLSPLRALWKGVSTWFCLVPVLGAAILVGYFILAYVQTVFPSMEPEEQDVIPLLLSRQLPEWFRWFMVGYAIVGAAVVEELVFRGILYGALRRYFTTAFSAVVSAVLFAMLHGYGPQLFYITVLGVALALLRERTGNLGASMALHMTNNAMALCLIGQMVWD